MASPVTVGIAVSGDDTYYRSNSTLYSTTISNPQIGDHTNASFRPYHGLRWKIPSEVTDPDYITSVNIKFVAVANATANQTFIRVVQGPHGGWGGTTGSSGTRPDAVWSNLGVGSGDTAEVGWTIGATTDGSTYTSPDISAAVKASMNSVTWDFDNDYIGVTIGPKGAGPNSVSNVAHFDHATATEPQLVIAYTIPSPSTWTPKAVVFSI